MADLIVWTDKYSVGCNYIDEQHKKLVDIINELYNATKLHETKNKLSEIIHQLVEYTKYHFSAEEKLLQEKGYNPEQLDQHKEAHKYFVEKIEIFEKRFNLGDELVTMDMMNFLKDWLLNHILKVDKQYSETVCKDVD